MKTPDPASSQLVGSYVDAILDTLGDGIYLSDRHGTTLWVNRMYERLTGLRREEIIGRNVQDLRREGVYDVALNPEIVATGKPATTVQITGKGRRLVLNGAPIFDQNGEVALVVTFARDVTLMAQMKDQIAEQRDLIEKYQRNFEYLAREPTQRSPLLAADTGIKRLQEQIMRLSPTDATVLLLGETGVGKDIFAHKLHEGSSRHDRPFVKVDCGAIPENLIESELFGYVPGAFSGALAKGKLGFFEMADKGTLFLDEIGELPLSMQAKLLRVLQDQEVVRVGSTQPRKVDVRILAATNRDLEEDVRQGLFRADLFYRLRVAVLHIPALRERKKDIPLLARHFLDRFASRYRKKMAFSPLAEEAMGAYSWPGNVRELENMVQSLVITCDREVIEVRDLPSALLEEQKPRVLAASQACHAANAEKRALKDIVSDIERGLIRDALEYHGSVAKVARLFQVDRTTIFRKLQREDSGESGQAGKGRSGKRAPSAARRRRG